MKSPMTLFSPLRAGRLRNSMYRITATLAFLAALVIASSTSRAAVIFSQDGQNLEIEFSEDIDFNVITPLTDQFFVLVFEDAFNVAPASVGAGGPGGAGSAIEVVNLRINPPDGAFTASIVDIVHNAPFGSFGSTDYLVAFLFGASESVAVDDVFRISAGTITWQDFFTLSGASLPDNTTPAYSNMFFTDAAGNAVTSTAFVPVPEPTTMALATSIVVPAVAWRAWRRRRASSRGR